MASADCALPTATSVTERPAAAPSMRRRIDASASSGSLIPAPGAVRRPAAYGARGPSYTRARAHTVVIVERATRHIRGLCMDIAELLAFSVKNKASDLHLSSGLPPMIRVDGDVRRINIPALDHKQVHALVYDI